MTDGVAPLPLIRTKLHRPPVAGDHLHRTHLLERLTKNLYRPLTLVSAPAGYGKTTLLSCWLESCDVPNTWLSMDENDDDLRVFLTYFLAAVQRIFPDAAQETRAMLNAPELPLLNVLSHSLINELDRIEKNFILVLDDYHVIHDKAVQDLLIELMKHPPGHIHLVLATRRDPSMPLTTYRAQGKMSEIRVNDLRFSLEETRTFLEQVMRSPIDDAVIATLNRRLRRCSGMVKHKKRRYDRISTGPFSLIFPEPRSHRMRGSF